MRRFVITEHATAITQWVVEAESREQAERQWSSGALVGVKPKVQQLVGGSLEDLTEIAALTGDGESVAPPVKR